MILGINSFTHDSSIALINSNAPILMLEEERLSRIKHHDGFIFNGTPPNRAIDIVKKSYSYSVIAHSSDIDYTAMSSNIPQIKFLEFARVLDPNLKKTKFFNHHLCHAASAFFCSDFDTAYIITLDSRGDGLSLTISIGRGNSLNKIFEIPARTSICSIYSYVSELLGLGKRNEGSLMALASFGERNISPILFNWNGKSININSEQIINSAKKSKIFTDKSNIAFTIQQSFEEVILKVVDDICTDMKIKNLCLAGGGFLNCKLNMSLNNSNRWKNIFIPPYASDSGTALGAALLSLDEPRKFKLHHAFWGTKYSKEVVRKILKKYKIKHVEANEYDIAKLISKGNIVALFTGAMEFGPRALGHRSLIADPRKSSSKTKLNEIKKRKQWRPVAPSILEEYGKEWFENYSFSPYMTCAFKIKDNKEKIVPAIVHVDNTSRIQSVTNRDGFIYDLLVAFNELTGIPLICNTSFNVNSPIVNSPQDAISTFYSSSIDCLYIEGLLITK